MNFPYFFGAEILETSRNMAGQTNQSSSSKHMDPAQQLSSQASIDSSKLCAPMCDNCGRGVFNLERAATHPEGTDKVYCTQDCYWSCTLDEDGIRDRKYMLAIARAKHFRPPNNGSAGSRGSNMYGQNKVNEVEQNTDNDLTVIQGSIPDRDHAMWAFHSKFAGSFIFK